MAAALGTSEGWEDKGWRVASVVSEVGAEALVAKEAMGA